MAAYMKKISLQCRKIFCVYICISIISTRQALGEISGGDSNPQTPVAADDVEDSQYPQSVVLEETEEGVAEFESEDFQAELDELADELQNDVIDDEEVCEKEEEIFDKPCERNTTADAETSKQGNDTKTDEQKPKYVCTKIELKENETASMKIINNTDLFQVLNRTNTTEGPCSVVLFYAPWCRFSAAVAPHINALGRAYPTLQVLAVDAIQFSGLNARFGTVAVPNILLFHNGKPVARFNQSERTFDTLKSFIKNHTGVEADPTVEVTEVDYLGPLPSVATMEPDYFLWFSTSFIIIFSCFIFKQKFGDRIMERFRTWAEIHEHMD